MDIDYSICTRLIPPVRSLLVNLRDGMAVSLEVRRFNP